MCTITFLSTRYLHFKMHQTNDITLKLHLMGENNIENPKYYKYKGHQNRNLSNSWPINTYDQG